MHSSYLFVIAFTALASARTDLSGCVSSETVRYGGASLLWYVPGTGEICEALDCGGGRAPPKTTVAGCPSYEGTGTYSPSFIALATSTTAAPSSSTAVSSAMITDSPEASSTASASLSTDGSGETTSSTFLPVGTGSPNSNSTGPGAGSNPSSTGTAPITSVTGNAASLNTLNGLIGVVAAGFAFLL